MPIVLSLFNMDLHRILNSTSTLQTVHLEPASVPQQPQPPNERDTITAKILRQPPELRFVMPAWRYSRFSAVWLADLLAREPVIFVNCLQSSDSLIYRNCDSLLWASGENITMPIPKVTAGELS